MKSIVLFLFVLSFSFSAIAQEKFPELASVKGLSSLNLNKSSFQIDKSLSVLNSKESSLPVINKLSKINLKSALSLKSIEMKEVSNPKKWNFSIIPYAFFASIGGTVGEGPEGGVYGFNKGFTFDNLKMYAAFTGKIKYERVSFVFDIFYVNYKGFGATASSPNVPKYVNANWTAKQAVYDLFLAYLFPSKSKKTMVDIYGGGRLWGLDLEATFTNAAGDSSIMTNPANNSWLDPVIGVNAEFLLSKDMKWAAWTKGDIGGFGVNHSMTWQMNVGVAYMLSPHFPLTLGFKYIGVNYYKNKLNWTVNEYGPTLGIGYRY